MPDTLTIAGRTYKRSTVIAGLAAVGGIVAYAWWSRSSGEAPEAELLVPEVPEEPTGVLPFGGTTSGRFTEDTGGFRTDQDWYKAAVELLLLDYGVEDTATAAAAVNRYLASQPLTAAQVPMIHHVINTLGSPPSGTRTIRQEAATPGSGHATTQARLDQLGKVRGGYLAQIRDRQAKIAALRRQRQTPHVIAQIRQLQSQIATLQRAVARVESQIRQLQGAA